MRNFKCCIIYFFLGVTHYVVGRWALPEEAPVQVEFYNRDIVVNSDGRTEEIIEVKRKILNEQGRDNFGTQTIIYNENSEEIHILEAKVISQKQEYPVPASMIEKKPLASDSKAFDQLMQMLIAYPKCDIGNELYLKYKLVCQKQPLPNYFATEFHYARDGYWKESTVTLNSALPFNVLVNDPKDKLKVQKTKNSLSIKLKEPLYESLTHEPDNGFLEDKYQTWVKVSSLESFEDLAKGWVQDYESVLSQPLPKILEDIIGEKNAKSSASCQKIGSHSKSCSEIDQINHITSLLSEKVRYMGDWRTLQGRYCPRALEEIVSTGIGDCKDFAVCTVAMLRKLSYEANIALVMRGVYYNEPENQLPSTDGFNHAIVKVVGQQGNTYWIDPTNFESMANGIFADIANRKALVLKKGDLSYEKIPSIDHEHSRLEVSERMTLSSENDCLSVDGGVKLFGEQAIFLTGAVLKDSPRSVEERFVHSFCGELSPLSQKVWLPDLNSRIVEDLEIRYSYEQEKRSLLTNKGQGIFLSPILSSAFIDTHDEQICAIFLGFPMTFSRKIFIPEMNVENAQVFNFDIKTPWLSVGRSCSRKNDGVELDEQVAVSKSWVSREELKTKTYLEAKNTIKQYFQNSVIIFESQQKK